jgi:hypothetical protein
MQHYVTAFVLLCLSRLTAILRRAMVEAVKVAVPVILDLRSDCLKV